MRRREFISRLLRVIGGAVLARVVPAGKVFGAPLIFDLGFRRQYPPGTVKYLNYRDAYLVSDEEGIYVLSSICPHQGCSIVWREKGGYFECPRHRSRFDIEGKVIRGPSRDPLPWLKLELTKGKRLKLHRKYKGETGVKIAHE